MSESSDAMKKPAAEKAAAPTSLVAERMLATAMLRQGRAEDDPLLVQRAQDLATGRAPKATK
jgi:hypothetical protein